MIRIPTLPRIARGTRDDRTHMIEPMAEDWQPPARSTWARWVPLPVTAWRQRLIDMAALTRWMDVERSHRWLRNERGGTYCDHYAADWFSQWIGAARAPVVPPLAAWLWWRREPTDRVIYEETVIEYGATSLYDWLEVHATSAGWIRFQDEGELREWMNKEARPGLVIGRTKGRGASHVAVALPDAVEQALRVPLSRGGTAMLTTAAGGTNRMLDRHRWWPASAWAGVQFLGLAG